MNANELNAAMQYIDDAYLDIAEAPQKEIMQMKKLTRILLIAAVVAMLAATAYAADFLNVQSLISFTKATYAAFPELEQAMEEAGFRMDAKEVFDTGYAFENVSVKEVRGEDENGEHILTYSSITVFYRNQAGKYLIFAADPDLKEIIRSEREPEQSRTIGNITVKYCRDHYKFVPDDYEPTDEDKAWMEQPGNYISYGSDEIEEKDVAFLGWTKDGVVYNIMDPNGTEQPETLFAMAEELICK